MRHALLMAALLLAGCAQSPSSDPVLLEPGPDQQAASFAEEGCPLTFPDGSAFDCDAAQWTQPSGTEQPSTSDGWRCTRDYEDDFGNVYELWSHADGRHGAYFAGTPWKETGVALYSVQLYTGDGGWAVQVPHQASAFVELPDMPVTGRVDLHLLFTQLRLFESQPGSDTWQVDPPGAELVVDTFGGHSWYVWEVPKRNGTFYLSHMQADEDPEELARWKARDHEAVAPDGSEYIADANGNGIKYLGRDASEHGFIGAGTCKVA